MSSGCPRRRRALAARVCRVQPATRAASVTRGQFSMPRAAHLLGAITGFAYPLIMVIAAGNGAPASSASRRPGAGLPAQPAPDHPSDAGHGWRDLRARLDLQHHRRCQRRQRAALPLPAHLASGASGRRPAGEVMASARAALGCGTGPRPGRSRLRTCALGARDGVTVRGRARMLAMPARSAAPGPPRPVGFRDGQICRRHR